MAGQGLIGNSLMSSTINSNVNIDGNAAQQTSVDYKNQQWGANIIGNAQRELLLSSSKGERGQHQEDALNNLIDIRPKQLHSQGQNTGSKKAATRKVTGNALPQVDGDGRPGKLDGQQPESPTNAKVQIQSKPRRNNNAQGVGTAEVETRNVDTRMINSTANRAEDETIENSQIMSPEFNQGQSRNHEGGQDSNGIVSNYNTKTEDADNNAASSKALTNRIIANKMKVNMS